MNRQGLDDAARFATCQVLSAAGEGLVGAAVFPVWPAPYRAAAFTLGSLSILGAVSYTHLTLPTILLV